MLNDAEAKLLTEDENLVRAGHKVLQMGPKFAVIKKGEHGALLMTKDFFFVAPGFPVEDVFDPTGAGDTFAGGFFASLASNGNFFDETSLRRAVILGTVLASYNVESFSLDRLKTLTRNDIIQRYNLFKKYTQFEPADHSTTFHLAPSL